MKADNPVGTLHHCLAHAVYQGFPMYSYETRDWDHYTKTNESRNIVKSALHSEHNIGLYSMFPQTWSSTALGFGGLGGNAITTAYTVVLESEHGAGFCVYFGGRFAYRIERPSEKFFEDIVSRQMCEVKTAKKIYEREAKEESNVR